MSKGSIITLVVAVIAIFVGLWVYKDQRQTATNREARAAATAYVHGRNALVPYAAQLETLINKHHETAFAKGYIHGGMFKQSEYLEQDYFDVLWKLVRADARAEGEDDLAAMLPGAGDDEIPDQPASNAGGPGDATPAE